MKKIKLLLSIEDKIFREDLANYLLSHKIFDPVVQISSNYGIIEELEKYPVHIVLVDLDSFYKSIFRELKKGFPKVIILGISKDDTASKVAEFLRCGGHGFLYKYAKPSEFSNGILAMHDDMNYFAFENNRVIAFICQRKPSRIRYIDLDLYPLEEQLIRCLWKDTCNSKLSTWLQISSLDVTTLKMRLCHRLNLESKEGLILWGIRNGIIDVSGKRVGVKA